MSFQYYDIENEIAAYLTPFLVNLADVIILPENQSRYKISTEKGLVVVAYAGSDFDSPISSDTVYQVENISIICNVTSSSLRDDTGVYNIIAVLRDKLQGYRAANTSGRMYLKSVQFDDRNQDDAIFSFNVEFTCRKPSVQTINDQDAGVPFAGNTVTLRDNY